MKNSRYSFYLIGSVLSIVVCFSVLELATRTISFVSGNGFFLSLDELDPYDKAVESIYQWHPFTGFIMKPGVAFQGGHPSQKERAIKFVDKYGFLAGDDTLTYAKEENEIRIATIGASTTANFNLPFEINWPGHLGILLKEKFPQKKISIINAGTPGFDTAQSIGNLALRVMPFKPDVVIIYHAYNDLKTVRYDSVFKPDYSHIHTKPFGYYEKPPFYVLWLNHSMAYVRVRNKYRTIKAEGKDRLEALNYSKRMKVVPPEVANTFEEHMRSLVSIAQAGGAQVVLSSFAILYDTHLDYSDKNVLNSLSDFQRKKIIGLLEFTPGLTLEAIFTGVNDFNDRLHSIAVDQYVGWVDNYSLIPHEDTYFVDRIHFSAAGAEKMAENMLPVVEKLLKEEGV